MSDLLEDVAGLEKALDFHSQRHGVLAANLANADTPNYVPKDINFAESLAAAPLRGTHAAHLSGGGADGQFVVEEMPIEPHFDGNGVEVEQAMAQVMANRLRYETGIELTRRRLAMLRYAASNGGMT